MKKAVVSSILACTICLSATVSAFAANIPLDENQAAGSATTTIEFVKEAAPTYTVTIPEKVSLSDSSTEMDFSLNLDTHEGVPMGKQVVVTIEQAGNPSGLAGMDSFCLVSENHDIAEFMLYESDRMATIVPYEIGDEIVTWNAGNWGTQTRMAKVVDYDAAAPGTYEGSVVYGIAMVDHSFN